MQKRTLQNITGKEKTFYFLDLRFGIKAKSLENSDFRFKVNMNNNIESLNISNTVSVFVIIYLNQ